MYLLHQNINHDIKIREKKRVKTFLTIKRDKALYLNEWIEINVHERKILKM